MAPSEIMRRIKGRSSSKLFAEFPQLTKKVLGVVIFGHEDFFCASSGNVTDEMIKTYLDHHFEPKKDDDFKTEY